MNYLPKERKYPYSPEVVLFSLDEHLRGKNLDRTRRFLRHCSRCCVFLLSNSHFQKILCMKCEDELEKLDDLK